MGADLKSWLIMLALALFAGFAVYSAGCDSGSYYDQMTTY